MAPKRKKSRSKSTRVKPTTAKPAKKAIRSKKAKAKKEVKKKKSKTTRATRRSGPQSLRPFSSREDAASGLQTGDLEGLSTSEQADSESVDELAEEGNFFEAGAVSGVEEADGADEREVHTHEVPEDDVPEEYLDKD